MLRMNNREARLFASEYCSLVEEFHIRNVVGCLEQKLWMFGDRVMIPLLASTLNVTISSMTAGWITNLPTDPRTGFPQYLVLAQKRNAAPSNFTFVDNKTTTQFRLNGDAGAYYDLVVMSWGAVQPSRRHLDSGGKWAEDYCPFCKAAGFKGIVGAVLGDVATFAFKHTLVAAADVITFERKTDTTGKHIGSLATEVTYYETGTEYPSRVTSMEDTDYNIIITKSTDLGGAVVLPPWPSAITTHGFTLNGDITEEYDVLILGQIQS
jgi:hypothetical protein